MGMIKNNEVKIARSYFKAMKGLKVAGKIAGWAGAGFGVVIVVLLLISWATHHLISFLIVMGVVTIPFIIWGWIKLDGWSTHHMMVATYEEKLAQYREKYGDKAKPPQMDDSYGTYYGSLHKQDPDRYYWNLAPQKDRW